MVEDAKAEKKEVSKRNWADDDEDGEGEDDVEIGGSTVAQVGESKPPMETADSVGRTVMPPKKPRVERERNIYGDFVVTKINIKEREIPVPEKNPDEEEEEEESSEEEEEPVKEEPEEEQKKAPVKILSKKEQKRLEDEEFERVMAEMAGKNGEAGQKPAEESKQSAAQETQGEVDEKKRLANQKKKEKKKNKAKQAQAENKPTEDQSELTEEQRQEAAAEAIRKRLAAKQTGAGRHDSKQAALQEVANRKKGKKKGPGLGYDR